MSKPKKQHFIPKVYLKHFSASDDGLGIYVLDHCNPYKKSIQKVNSGDAIFWKKDFYTTDYFEDVYHLERFFSKNIEDGYNELIKQIKSEGLLDARDFKVKLFQWIFYGKLRSPAFRNYFEDQLILTRDYNADETKILAKMAHLELFQNEELFDKVLNEILTHFLSKKWNLVKTIDAVPFFTSDSPGFSIRLDQLEKNHNTIPSTFWHNPTVDSLFFFPLTKNYGLEIVAYEEGSALELNLMNTSVGFKNVDKNYVDINNYWTICTGTIVISSDERSLKIVQQVNIK